MKALNHKNDMTFSAVYDFHTLVFMFYDIARWAVGNSSAHNPKVVGSNQPRYKSRKSTACRRFFLFPHIVAESRSRDRLRRAQ